MDKRDALYAAAIVGGGAAGMLAAIALSDAGVKDILLLERNDRLGKKLSATGNGQGNVTNADMNVSHYFSSDTEKVKEVLSAFGKDELLAYLTSLGGCFAADGEGRVYPTSRQAASVTDILRYALAERGVCVKTGEFVLSAKKSGKEFRLKTDKGEYSARCLLIAAGGKASPHFGTDGNGYALAENFGHSVTRLSPALVQLKTERDGIKGLKGVRIDCNARLLRGERELYACRGDVIFTDGGVSGNAVFKISSRAEKGDFLSVDLLPDCGKEALASLISAKAERWATYSSEELLRCIVHTAAARAVMRSLGIGAEMKCASLVGRADAIASRIKDYRLRIEGTNGFENAQVTKGGIPLSEVDGYLMSKKVNGLFFAGEILDVDGECGGYNLQWAFSCGVRCAKRIAELLHADR